MHERAGITRDRNEIAVRVERAPLHADRHRRHGLPRPRPDRRLDPRAGAGRARRRRRSRCSSSTRRPACGPATRRWPTCCAAGDDARCSSRPTRSTSVRRHPAGRRVLPRSASATRSPSPPRRASAPATCSTAIVERAAREADEEDEEDDAIRLAVDRAAERRQVDARQPLPRRRARDRLRRRGHDARRDRPAARGRRPPRRPRRHRRACAARRRSPDSVEYYTTLRSQRAVERADVALVVCDAHDGVTRAGPAHRRARDEGGLRDRARAEQVGRRGDGRGATSTTSAPASAPASCACGPKVLTASALTGRNVERVLAEAITLGDRMHDAHPDAASSTASSPRSSQARQPPAKQGHRLKLLYMAQIEDAPAALRDPGQLAQPRHARLRVLRREPPALALRHGRRPADHRLQRARRAPRPGDGPAARRAGSRYLAQGSLPGAVTPCRARRKRSRPEPP